MGNTITKAQAVSALDSIAKAHADADTLSGGCYVTVARYVFTHGSNGKVIGKDGQKMSLSEAAAILGRSRSVIGRATQATTLATDLAEAHGVADKVTPDTFAALVGDIANRLNNGGFNGGHVREVGKRMTNVTPANIAKAFAAEAAKFTPEATKPGKVERKRSAKQGDDSDTTGTKQAHADAVGDGRNVMTYAQHVAALSRMARGMAPADLAGLAESLDTLRAEVAALSESAAN